MSLQRGQQRRVHVYGLRGGADNELHVKSVGLIRDQLHAVENFLLEARLFHFQPEDLPGSGQRVEVEHAGIIAGPDLRFAGCGIRQGEVGAWNHCARGIGYHTLNGSSILRQRGRSQQTYERQQQFDVEQNAGTAHSSLRGSSAEFDRMEKAVNEKPYSADEKW